MIVFFLSTCGRVTHLIHIVQPVESVDAILVDAILLALPISLVLLMGTMVGWLFLEKTNLKLKAHWKHKMNGDCFEICCDWSCRKWSWLEHTNIPVVNVYVFFDWESLFYQAVLGKCAIAHFLLFPWVVYKFNTGRAREGIQTNWEYILNFKTMWTYTNSQ